MYTYNVIGQEANSVIKRTDAEGNIAFIPIDEGNSDYQAYLKSLNEASTL
jgi:hypothetical protein